MTDLFGNPVQDPQPAPRPRHLTDPYTGPFPRSRHSHRCKECGDAVACYKSKCTLPQRVELCGWCKPVPPGMRHLVP